MTAHGESRVTPMMQRYQEVKQETPGTLLLFRMGDFYEMFHEDAVVAAKVLGLTLTSRDKGSSNPVPMAGFPFHALEGYLAKLIQAGHRAAICDQVEDPKTAKGLVRREVTRIVTPGTLTDDALLDPLVSNYLAAVCPARDSIGVAWIELSTGRFQCLDVRESTHDSRTATRGGGPKHPGSGARRGQVSRTAMKQTGDELAASHAPAPLAGRLLGLPAVVLDEIARLQPAEILIPEEASQDPTIAALIENGSSLLTRRPSWSFAENQARELLLRHFETTTLEGFDLGDEDSTGIIAAGALLEYVQETQRSSLGHITKLEPFRRGSAMLIDETTRRSLELTRTQREGKREGSLLSVLDETITPMGARLLAEWLSNPLTDIAAINRRLDAVGEFVTDSMLARDIRDRLKGAYDLQRLASRVATFRASPRDLTSLAQTLALLPKLKAKLAGRNAELLRTLEARLDLCSEVRADIERSLVDEPPLGVNEGGVIRPGLDPQLDEFRDLARGGKQWIAAYQAQEIERTGITSLKVGFNRVFGYYLEVTAANKDKVPDDYIRKQTLKNQERYITPALKEYEDKVLRAEERAIALETELFQALKERTSGECRRLQQTAEVIAQIDVLSSLATLATSRDYCRPVITEAPILEIREGRHPVLDRLKPGGAFVPNDVHLHDGSATAISESNAETCEGLLANAESSPVVKPNGPAMLALITGPNMAGKSTYIRQAALLTILAQIGSFIPARSGVIGIADRIFARVGASDELGKGQSTFMVEMTETARILNVATSRSLVILDEIGRGTSTYDGISLAWAITEFLHDEVGCRTLFATHYHELTELPKTLSKCRNWNVAVHEAAGDVIFLHKIVPGAADRSYGIHVARLAGVPRDVIDRADIILEQLESDHHDATGKFTIPARQRRPRERQLTLFAPPPHPLLESIKGLNLDEMTPLDALQRLHRMKDELK
ncbi:MAG: DNA mismatch repair protein MutS [Planctomycetaceae bacterium]